jgi:LmbE family N-acetylglucosaminyl deacetylase
MTSGVRLLAVRAHPDDESSATGGILARYAALAVPTGVVICTRGEEGEIHDPDLDPEEAKPRLGDIREQELRAACDVLGVRELAMLGYRDSGMRDEPSNQHPAAFCNADLDEAAGRLVRIMREWQPQVVVTDNEGGGYGHPDHVMCHRVTVRAFAAAGDSSAYPAAGPPWSPARLYVMVSVADRWEDIRKAMEDEGMDTSFLDHRRRHRGSHFRKEDATVALDVSAYVETQRNALLRHRTQIPEDSYWVAVPPHIRPMAFGTAYLLRLQPPASPGEKDLDLFDGLD